MRSQAELRIEGTKHQVTIEENETILDAALKIGIDVPYSCMSGTCNSCQAKLLNGKVTMEFCDALTDDEIADGEILTCQATALTEHITVEWPE